ncbi:MAG: trypsin-like serine peptidase [Solirubrobacterales bacterium]
MNRCSIASVAAFAILAIVATTSQAAVTVHPTGQSASKVRNYWSAERMRAAIPADHLARSGKVALARKPGGGTTAGTSSEVTISPGTPLTAHGKVFFTDGGVNYVCSGTALTGDVIWTAGHCVNAGPGAFFTNFQFVPAYRDGSAPYGMFPATALLTTSGWSATGQFGVDSGAAVPGLNGSGQTLSAAVVERSITFNAPRNQSYSIYGYPAAKKFNGQRLRVCNTAWSRDDTSATPAAMGVPCDMTGGSSGGGWITSSGSVASNVSYGYGSLRNVLFGPHLEAEAESLYNAADAAG